MPTYEFRCAEHGVFDVVRPIARRDEAQRCPQCAADATRCLTAPQLRLGDARARRLLDATAATAHSPAVVTSPPARPTAGAPVARPAADPRHARLPRP